MKVKLKFAHTHAGTQYPAGATVDLPLLDALWLKAEDVVEESIDDIKAEFRKLTGKDKDAHQGALDKAIAADAARKSAAPAVATTAPVAPSAPPADTKENKA